jgi:hypothetical protein
VPKNKSFLIVIIELIGKKMTLRNLSEVQGGERQSQLHAFQLKDLDHSFRGEVCSTKHAIT